MISKLFQNHFRMVDTVFNIKNAAFEFQFQFLKNGLFIKNNSDNFELRYLNESFCCEISNCLKLSEKQSACTMVQRRLGGDYCLLNT